MGVIMGLINMKTVETYWTEEFLNYANQVKQKEDMKLAEEERSKQRNDSLSNNSGSDILKPIDSNRNISVVQPVMVDGVRTDSSVLSGAVHTGSTTTDRISTITKEVI